MNKKALVAVLIIVVAIAGGAGYLLLSSPSETEQDMMSKTGNDTSEPATNSQDQSASLGSYVDYSETIIAETEGTKLLFFHAPWCPQCRALESDIKQSGVPSGVTIIKVDYDSNQSLRQKYGVTLQTTLVRVDDQGNLVEKFVAYDEPSLEAVKRNLL